VLQNEKKKDKDLTERITNILKQRDACMKGVDISASYLPLSCTQALMPIMHTR
jgi:hypothetical protein